MFRDGNSGYQGPALHVEGEFFQVQACGFAQIRKRFFDCIALSGRTGFRIQSDVPTFRGGRQNGCEFHCYSRFRAAFQEIAKFTDSIAGSTAPRAAQHHNEQCLKAKTERQRRGEQGSGDSFTYFARHCLWELRYKYPPGIVHTL